MKKSYHLVIIFLLPILSNTNLIAQSIITVAGHPYGYISGADAKYGEIKYPGSMTFDKSGNLYFVDGRSIVSRLDVKSKVLAVVAGSEWTSGFSGDGGEATKALFSNPADIAFDFVGNMYVSDYSNNRIRKIEQNGIISTIAGNGVDSFSGDGQPAIKATLNGPNSIKVFHNALYILDEGNSRLRKIDDKGIITTIAGSGIDSSYGDGGLATKAGLDHPTDFAIDDQGNIFITEFLSGRVRVVDKNGLINTVKDIRGIYFSAVETDHSNNLFVGDAEGNLFFYKNMDTVIQLYRGNDYGFYGNISDILYNDLDSTILVSATNEDNCYGVFPKIARNTIDDNKRSVIIQGHPEEELPYFYDSVIATQQSLFSPSAFTFDKSGNLYIANTGLYDILKIDATGFTTRIAGIRNNSGYSGDGGPAIKAKLNQVTGLCFDDAGNLYVADQGSNRIRKIDAAGIITTIAGNGSEAYFGDSIKAINAGLDPGDIIFDKNGNLYVSDYYNNRIRKIDKDGIITNIAGTGVSGFNGDNIPAKEARLDRPSGLCIANDNSLLFTDRYNGRVRKIDRSGIIKTYAGGGDKDTDGVYAKQVILKEPMSVATDSAGNLFIAEANGQKIRKVDTARIISTAVGTGKVGYYRCDGTSFYEGHFSGDGVPADQSSIYKPQYVRFDKSGNLYVADSYNHVIRKVLYNPASVSIALQSTSRFQYVNKRAEIQTHTSRICEIEPAGPLNNRLNRILKADVIIEKKPLKDSTGTFYCARHYSLTAIAPSEDQTALITLYFTQKEFNQYNQQAGSLFKRLPVSPDDEVGKSNVRIDIISNRDGKPLTKAQEKNSMITKKPNSVKWNNTGKYWEITFPIRGLNAYYLTTPAEARLIAVR